MVHRTRSFLFMDAVEVCSDPNSPQCYLNNPQAAEQVVLEFEKLGFNTFLIPSASPAQVEIIGTAIKNHGFQFFTYERWSWEGAMRNGVFSCQDFRTHRLDGELRALKKKMGSAFGGFHFKDEPSITQLDSLKALKDCLKSDPEFSSFPILLNLLPLEANAEAVLGTDPSGQLAGLQKPAEYGVDCASGKVVDRAKWNATLRTYNSYVQAAADKVSPEYFAFDFYPFNRVLAQCKVAMEMLMSENLNSISSMARSRGIEPVAYLQNRTSIPTGTLPPFYFRASFNHLRWFSSWASAFGFKEFASFISHDFTSSSDPMGGLLNLWNQPTDVAREYRDYRGFRAPIDQELRSYRFDRFVAPFLGVNSGGIVGWLPSDQVLIGEYHSQNGQASDLLFVARRDVDRPVRQVPISLTRWYQKVEVLNFNTGRWDAIGASTNTLSVSLDDFPGAVFRLTH